MGTGYGDEGRSFFEKVVINNMARPRPGVLLDRHLHAFDSFGTGRQEENAKRSLPRMMGSKGAKVAALVTS
jgi:hypothetical protein